MKKFNLLAVLAAVILSSCSGDDESVARSEVTLNVIGLQQLESNTEYQAWLVSGGENISLGRFRDNTFPKTFNALKGQVDNATGFKLSIESGNDNSPAISNTILLEGNFSGNGNSATLTVKNAIGNFDNSEGVFVLQTPTDDNQNNEKSGVYWYNPTSGQQGLDLPVLPQGWLYEGWVSVPDASGKIVNLSTGKFRDPSRNDQTAAFSFQINPAPKFPGEDFINQDQLSPRGLNALPDLSLKRIFISIEPENDNDSSEPFNLRPLLGTAGNQTSPTINTMSLNTASFPIGTFTKDF